MIQPANATTAGFECFSLNPGLIEDIFTHARPLGHHENPQTHNLGFGFVYYGLARALRPRHVLVIGSGFGFSVICLALGLRDNAEGQLTFVDPAFHVMKNGPFQTIGGRGTWSTPQKVHERFARFGVDHLVTHHKLTSEGFFATWDHHDLSPIDLAFIDGNHSLAHVRHDFEQCLAHSRRNTYMLLHDTNIYVRELVRHAGVKRYVNWLRRQKDAFEVIDFPFSSGVALVRVLDPGAVQRP